MSVGAHFTNGIDEMVKLKGTRIGGEFVIEGNSVKRTKENKRLSVSTRIAKRKKPKQTYKRGK